ncbi:MAG: serine acetyltransferase [Desulfobacca sp.]|nr:serine acetyltransferase [Desulfobacca sp.]
MLKTFLPHQAHKKLDEPQSFSGCDVHSLARELLETSEPISSERDKHIIASPNPEAVIQLVEVTRQILFPDYWKNKNVLSGKREKILESEIQALYNILIKQINLSIPHDDCKQLDCPCTFCLDRGHEKAAEFLQSLPKTKNLLVKDIQAAFEGDPAAKSHTEIIVSYPGIFAITVYRIAHTLQEMGIPLLPRMMTEYAHSRTGIDIHPGARIGEFFFIDHGTGVVIGETTVIGDRVRIYQGVTLGALSLPSNAGDLYRHKKRHPTIENDVIIYANATILGGETIIGARTTIGGNVWITESVTPDTKVILNYPDHIYLRN